MDPLGGNAGSKTSGAWSGYGDGKSKIKRKTTYFAVGASVAAAVAAIVLVSAGKKSDGEGKPRWQTAPVVRTDIYYKVTASGTLSPLKTVNVGSQVSGRLKEIFVDFNSEVTKGQVLATIDPSLIEFDVAKSRAARRTALAAISRAEASLFDRKQVWERTVSLREKKLATDMETDSALAAYQSAQAELQSARASLAQAEAAVKQAETNLQYTTIVSPIDGVVISREIDVGQTVAASFQAPVLFKIAEDLRRMEVHTSLAESDVGQVKDGMPVEFRVDAFPSRVFTGTVKQVRYSPTTVQNVVTYDAVVSVDNPDLSLRPGMTADVAFVVSSREGTLAVPNTALRFKPPENMDGKGGAPESIRKDAARKPGGNMFGFGMPPRPPEEPRKASDGDGAGVKGVAGGRRSVQVPGKDGTLTKIEVTTGISDGKNTEIVDGLKEGDVVVIGTATADAAFKAPTGPM